MLRKILDVLILMSPRWWIMNYSYNKRWDEELNELMSKYKFEEDGEHHIKLGSARLWISNYPYAAFTYHPNRSGRPSRLTILRAKRKMKHDLTNIDKIRDRKLKQLGI
jgi:hypothetical protein